MLAVRLHGSEGVLPGRFGTVARLAVGRGGSGQDAGDFRVIELDAPAPGAGDDQTARHLGGRRLGGLHIRVLWRNGFVRVCVFFSILEVIVWFVHSVGGRGTATETKYHMVMKLKIPSKYGFVCLLTITMYCCMYRSYVSNYKLSALLLLTVPISQAQNVGHKKNRHTQSQHVPAGS